MANRQTFTIAESPEAFKVLSSNLYSNPILAVIRELSTNAYDAQLVAGTNDEHQIEVHLPTHSEPFFRVRDWGTGLSEDEVFTIYTQFFSSTKKDDEKQIGAFGLGSKSPFAITSIYKVNSYQNGEVKRYLMDASSSYPIVSLESTEETLEHDGLEVIIENLENTSFSAWEENAQKLFRGTAFLPNINLDAYRLDEVIDAREFYTTENITFVKDVKNPSYYDRGSVTVNVAGATFKVKDSREVFDCSLQSTLGRGLNIYNVNIMAEKFDVTLTPSREELHYDEKTVKFIKNKLAEVLMNYIKNIDENTISGLKTLFNFYIDYDDVRLLSSDNAVNLLFEKTKKYRETFTESGRTQILEGLSLVSSTHFPFIFKLASFNALLNGEKVFYVDFKGATKAQEKALDKLLNEHNIKNNVVNCLASHFYDVVLKGVKSSKKVYYIFKKLDKTYTELFNVETIKVKDYENFFKRYSEKTEDKKEKVKSTDSFINSQTMFFTRGCGANIDWLRNHKSELEETNTKLLKIVGTTEQSIQRDGEMLRHISSFLGNNFVIAYRRGPYNWYEKKSQEPGIISKERAISSLKELNPENAKAMSEALKFSTLNSRTYLSEIDSHWDIFKNEIDKEGLEKLQGWKVLKNPNTDKAANLKYEYEAFLRRYVFTPEEIAPSKEELEMKDFENEQFELLDAISFYRLSTDTAKKQLIKVVNSAIKACLSKMA